MNRLSLARLGLGGRARPLLAVVALVTALVAACGQLPRPFETSHNHDEEFRLMPLDKAGMVVHPPEGMPGPAATAFTTALVDALRNEDVAAMTGPGNPASLVLGGSANAEPGGWSIKLALADSNRIPVGSVTSHASPQPVDDPKSWSPYARTMAKSIAAMLQSDGTAPRLDRPRVTLGDISGLPDADRRMLVHALEYVLQKARLQIATSPDKATHVILGSITISSPRGSVGRPTRNVDVHWTVQRADKTEIGELHQSNDVPVDMLDHDWPDIAMAVADAAADGIVGLVNRPATAGR